MWHLPTRKTHTGVVDNKHTDPGLAGVAENIFNDPGIAYGTFQQAGHILGPHGVVLLLQWQGASSHICQKTVK